MDEAPLTVVAGRAGSNGRRDDPSITPERLGKEKGGRGIPVGQNKQATKRTNTKED